METYTTERNGIGLIHNDYRFRKHEKRSNTLSWKCSVSKCSAGLVTNLEMNEIKRTTNLHNHEPPSQKEKRPS